ncbi:MAG: hypothetical protein WBA17_17590 [Saprospiraceae bacterium]
MRIVFNIVLLLIAAGLAWALYSSISEPIAFNNVRTLRENAVSAKLEKIRDAQEIYRDVTGNYAPRFDTLIQVLRNGKVRNIVVNGDPDDPNFTGTITYDTTYTPAIEEVNRLKLNLDSLNYVPYGKGATFEIAADTITYQSTPGVPVVEVGVVRNKFMEGYGARFARYDPRYDPNSVIKFGDLQKPNLSGNWE